MKKSRRKVAPKKPSWTFLSNYGHVLLCLHGKPDLTVKEIAIRVGITERAVLRILSGLEADGYIRRARLGRRSRYSIAMNKKLRHPIEANTKIKALLDLI